jgi:V8-like Glu-specific endopeptidase
MLVLLASLACLSPAASAPAAVPTGHHVASIRTVGPLFLASVFGLGPRLGLPHYCTASVVHSATHDLAITAAHCVYGTGSGIEFAPGYSGRSAPYGVWDVRRVYLPRAWLRDHDPQHDFAVLALARHGSRGVEDVTGRAPRLGVAPAAGTRVTVDGYVAGSGGTPLTCTAPVYYTLRFPSFDCNGFAAGVSGGPWLAGGRLVGVTGGLHQGGCTAATSYTSAFGPDVAALLARAVAGGPGDSGPIPGSDGC